MSKDKIIEKMKKLHALANCATGNENETAVAAARFAEYMVKHGISMAEIEAIDFEEEEIDPLIVKLFLPDQKNVNKWQQVLLNAIANMHNCQLISEKVGGVRGWDKKVYGHESDVQSVSYIFAFVQREIAKYVEVWSYKTDKYGKSERTQYKLGMAMGIISQMRAAVEKAKQEARAEGKQTALVKFEDRANQVDQFVRGTLPNVKTNKTNLNIKNAAAYAAGKQQGENLNLNMGNNKGLNAGKKALKGE